MFLEALDGHTHMYEPIPAYGKHFRLPTGVISSVVKITVNHSRVVDAFSLTLYDMDRDLRTAQRKMNNE